MARRRATAVLEDPYAPIIEEYRERLARPAPPIALWRWPPVAIGPTWQRTDDGQHWLLPDLTIGWFVLAWCGRWLQRRRGVPWRFTDEQARWILWWYAVDERGEFAYRDGILQRLKGWGKDPVGACLCLVEAFGPCRFLEFDADGQPVATDCPDAWVQIAAVSIEQTKTTCRLFPGLITAEAKATYGIIVGKEHIYGLGGERFIQAVTSSPATLEGARSTFVLANETQHWTSSNAGHDMAAVIERNTTKSEDGAARTLRITNAYEPSQDSVAQRDREAWEMAQAGTAEDAGVMYDSLEAPPDAPLTAEAAPDVVAAIRGDSTWLNIRRICKSIVDLRNPPSRSRRFWYNQVVAREDAWADLADFDLCPTGTLQLGDEIALFFDGSKSDDATALAGCRISDGLVVTLGLWQKPPGRRGEGWTTPRPAVDDRVDEVFERYQVAAFWADPSHTRDDETTERYWDDTIDGWHRRHGSRIAKELWAVTGRDGAHAVMWDMASPQRTAAFTAAAERAATDIEEHTFLHDGDRRLRIHVRNAVRYSNRYGVSLWKGHRESPRKIDLAVAAVGARMLRRVVLNSPARKRQRSGRVW